MKRTRIVATGLLVGVVALSWAVSPGWSSDRADALHRAHADAISDSASPLAASLRPAQADASSEIDPAPRGASAIAAAGCPYTAEVAEPQSSCCGSKEDGDGSASGCSDEH